MSVSYQWALRLLLLTALCASCSGVASGQASTDSLRWAVARMADGEYARAEPVARRLWQAPDDVPRRAEALDVWVETMWRQGFATRDDVRALAEQAIAQRDTSVAAMDPAAVPALLNQGAIETQNGRFDRARVVLDRALEIRMRVPGADSLDLAVAWNECATLDLRQGRFAAAEDRYESILALRRRHLGSDHVLVAWALNQLATVAEAKGDHLRARDLLRECLAIRQRVLPPDHPDLARALKALANDEYAVGANAAGLRLDEQALRIFERTLGPDSPEVARSLNGLAGRQRLVGALPEARRTVLRALAIRERLFDRWNPEVATSLLTLARIQLDEGDSGAAVDTLRRALAIRVRAFGPEAIGPALVLDELARALLFLGQPDSAAAACEWSLRAKRRGLAPGHPDQATTLRILADVRLAQGDTVAASLAGIETERITRNQLLRMRTSLSEVESLEYESIRASGLGLAARMACRQAATEAERRAVFTAMVQSHSALQEAAWMARTGADTVEASGDVQPWIPKGAVLVSYLRCPEDAPPLAHPAVYVACVARRDEPAPRFVWLGGATRLDSTIASWRAAILEPGESADRVRALGQEIRRALWDPVASGESNVLMAIEGPIEAVDFYALPTSSGRFLIESGVRLERLASERELMHVADLRPTGHLVALGFEGRTKDPRTALPNAPREAEEVSRLWQQAGGSKVSTSRTATLLRGREATRDALRRSVRDAEVLHLATHAGFKDATFDPLQVFRPGAHTTAGLRQMLLRSGLELAPGPGDPKGFLSVLAASTLELDHTRWVVLSGCETGRGTSLGHEGSLGLQRAFKRAGARVVIGTLWPVEDRVAREWIARFYGYARVPGCTASDAVRAASLSRLHASRRLGLGDSPRTWAGFVAIGSEPRAISARADSR